jgi:hypothetical protein
VTGPDAYAPGSYPRSAPRSRPGRLPVAGARQGPADPRPWRSTTHTSNEPPHAAPRPLVTCRPRSYTPPRPVQEVKEAARQQSLERGGWLALTPFGGLAEAWERMAGKVRAPQGAAGEGKGEVGALLHGPTSRLIPISFLLSPFSFLLSHFSFLISHFSFLISHFLFSISISLWAHLHGPTSRTSWGQHQAEAWERMAGKVCL